MFCPNCGARQTGRRKFCTACGTNLLVVSQALSGQIQTPIQPNTDATEHQREFAKGVKLAVIGGAILVIQFLSFVFSLPFRRVSSPFGFFSFIAIITMAIGISKLISARHNAAAPIQPLYQQMPTQMPSSMPSQPPSLIESSTPITSGLNEDCHPMSSVTEEETRHLPEHARRAKHHDLNQ